MTMHSSLKLPVWSSVPSKLTNGVSSSHVSWLRQSVHGASFVKPIHMSVSAGNKKIALVVKLVLLILYCKSSIAKNLLFFVTYFTYTSNYKCMTFQGWQTERVAFEMTCIQKCFGHLILPEEVIGNRWLITACRVSNSFLFRVS